MTPPVIERWDSIAGNSFSRRRLANLAEIWVPGLVKPGSAPGTVGPKTAEINMANYSGSFSNVSDGQVIENLIISHNVSMTSSNATLRNCKILNKKPSDYVASVAGQTPKVILAVKCLTAGVSNILIEDCIIDVPVAERTFDHYGVQGRGFTLRRTEITGVVDGVVAHGNTSVQGDVVIEGCYIHGLQRYEYDPRQTDGSHNDGIQVEGALGIKIVGNTILGGYTSAILVTQNVAHPDDYKFVTITDNWLDLEAYGGSVVNVAEKDRGAIDNYTLARNKIGRIAYDLGRPLILTASLTKSASTTYMPTTGPDANVFEDDGTSVPLGFPPF